MKLGQRCSGMRPQGDPSSLRDLKPRAESWSSSFPSRSVGSKAFRARVAPEQKPHMDAFTPQSPLPHLCFYLCLFVLFFFFLNEMCFVMVEAVKATNRVTTENNSYSNLAFRVSNLMCVFITPIHSVSISGSTVCIYCVPGVDS